MKGMVTGLTAAHLALTIWHGSAHQSLGVQLPPEKTAFVVGVIVMAPIIAALLVWTRYVVAGAWVFCLSMLGSFLFGAYHHYVLLSTDHVHHLPAGSADAHGAFVVSAAVLAVLELACTIYGAFWLGVLRTRRSGPNG
jgi:NADPH:quinone reductase-like Zn-dependent oxidoreductase